MPESPQPMTTPPASAVLVPVPFPSAPPVQAAPGLPAAPVSLLFAAVGVLVGAAAFFGPAAIHSQQSGTGTKYFAIPLSGLPLGLTSTQTALAMPIWPMVLTAVLIALAYGSNGGRRLTARLSAVSVAVFGVAMIYGQFRDWVATFTGANRWNEGDTSRPDTDSLDLESIVGDRYKDVTVSVGWGTWLLLSSLVLLAVAAATAARRVPAVPPFAAPPHRDGIEVTADNTVWAKPSP